MPDDEQVDEDPAPDSERESQSGGGGKPTGEIQAAINRENDPPS
jgi:hypothetical protein